MHEKPDEFQENIQYSVLFIKFLFYKINLN